MANAFNNYPRDAFTQLRRSRIFIRSSQIAYIHAMWPHAICKNNIRTSTLVHIR